MLLKNLVNLFTMDTSPPVKPPRGVKPIKETVSFCVLLTITHIKLRILEWFVNVGYSDVICQRD